MFPTLRLSMAQKNDLEFVSVDQNEEDFSMNETYPLNGGEGRNLLGNTILNQSKVYLLCCRVNFIDC